MTKDWTGEGSDTSQKQKRFCPHILCYRSENQPASHLQLLTAGAAAALTDSQPQPHDAL